MAAVDSLHLGLPTSDEFYYFTDHHNLFFLYILLAAVPELSQKSLKNVFWFFDRLGTSHIRVLT